MPIRVEDRPGKHNDSVVVCSLHSIPTAAGSHRVSMSRHGTRSPSDSDGPNADGVDLEALDPILLDLSNHRAAQKARFGGELFPNVIEAQSGLSFSEFFQNERDTSRKGIVVIHLPEGDGQ